MKEFINKLIGRLDELGWLEDTPLEEIVNELAEEFANDCCKWKFTKSIVDGGYFYNSGCNHKRFSDLHGFEFCPYCGKKIKVVK